MLTPEQVMPFLTHDEAIVRRAADDYLRWTEWLVPDLSRPYWDALQKVGFDKDRHLLGTFSDIAPSLAVFDACLAAVETLPPAARPALERSLSRGPIPSLKEREQDVLRLLSGNATLHEHVRQRIAMAETTPQEAWDEMMDYGVLVGASRGQMNHRLEDRLVEVLTRDAEFTARRVMPALRACNWDDARAELAARLAGETNCPAAADMLMVTLAMEHDYLREEAEHALARLATTDPLVAHLAEAYEFANWDVRVSLAAVLSNVRRPAAEVALLRLLQNEEDEALRDQIAAGLASMCSTSLAEVAETYRIDDPHAEERGVQWAIAAAAVITGETLPEALVGPWREDAARREAEDAARLPLWSDERDESVEEIWDDMVDGDPIRPVAFPPGSAYERLEPIKSAPKVGRNDPCPCGSGKKYKRCCLNKG